MDCETCIHYPVCGLIEEYKDLKNMMPAIIYASSDEIATKIMNRERYFQPMLLCKEYREEGD